MTKYQLKKIKKEYEKGNLIPFIKATKNELDMSTLYDCDYELNEWWASKAIEFFELLYEFRANKHCWDSSTEYICKNLPWDLLCVTEYRIPDEFLDKILACPSAYEYLRKFCNNCNASGTYLLRMCSEHKCVKQMINDNKSKERKGK